MIDWAKLGNNDGLDKVLNKCSRQKCIFAAMNLTSITTVIAPELLQFEIELKKVFSSPSESMSEILQYIAESQGKRMRPALVFLAAKLFGEVNESTLRTALFVEMIHSATLLHDDVVDGDEQRRGRASANVKFGNHNAILAGDFLFAKAIKLIANPDDHQIMVEMLQTANAMSEGELIQNEAPKAALSEEKYLDIITRKTAMLKRSSCAGGALSVGADDIQVERLALFGLNLGIVFQMRDDMLDNDQPECVAYTKQLMPFYLDRAMKSLEGLPNTNVLQTLKDLLMFCAEREY